MASGWDTTRQKSGAMSPDIAAHGAEMLCWGLADLENDLTIPSRLQERLGSAGERFFFEPTAVMIHWEASSLKDTCRILFKQGKGMGYIRHGASRHDR